MEAFSLIEKASECESQASHVMLYSDSKEETQSLLDQAKALRHQAQQLVI